jgi:NlpC/P60 family
MPDPADQLFASTAGPVCSADDQTDASNALSATSGLALSPACASACCPGVADPQPRALSSAQGQDVSQHAESVAADYQDRGVTYQMGGDASSGGDTSDCSHFVHDVLQQSGVDTPYTTTAGMSSSANFTQVPAADAQAGDVLVQGGHMGVFTGQTDAQGRPMGTQMGNHGAQDGPFGPGGWFPSGNDLRYYRPVESP